MEVVIIIGFGLFFIWCVWKITDNIKKRKKDDCDMDGNAKIL